LFWQKRDGGKTIDKKKKLTTQEKSQHKKKGTASRKAQQVARTE